MFKESFKYYKSRNPFPDLKDVIDLNQPDFDKVKGFNETILTEEPENVLGLRPVKDWKIYEFRNVPGLIFIRNPFTISGQRYWIIKCLKDYTATPYKLNLDAHDLLSTDEHWWDLCFGNSEGRRELLPKLRWATLGYHHNWHTKEYSEDCKTQMPEELSRLTSFLAVTLGFKEFKAEAAIVNYYRMNSTLAGHTDRSEINVEAPLFSISFGQTGIFLIGGLTQDDAAKAILLRSGDIAIMSGKSRLRYHGVPRILPADLSPWDEENAGSLELNLRSNSNDWNKARTYVSDARININVRQVLKPGQLRLLR